MIRFLFLVAFACGCSAPRPYVAARVVAECQAGRSDEAVVRAEAVAEWR